MTPRILAIAAAVLFIGSGSASAQQVDIGGAISDFYVGYGNGNSAGAGPVVTVHFNGKHALEVVTGLHYEQWMNARLVTGTYSVQYRRTFQRTGSATRVFLTAGTVGGASWQAISGFPSRFRVSPPWVPVAGAGVEHNIKRRIVLRADATGAAGPYGAVGVRIAAGAVVKLRQPITR